MFPFHRYLWIVGNEQVFLLLSPHILQVLCTKYSPIVRRMGSETSLLGFKRLHYYLLQQDFVRVIQPSCASVTGFHFPTCKVGIIVVSCCRKLVWVPWVNRSSVLPGHNKYSILLWLLLELGGNSCKNSSLWSIIHFHFYFMICC